MRKTLAFINSHWLAVTLFILAAITALSLWPQEQLPSVPGTDKTHHLIAYAALMFPAAWRKPPRWLLIGIVFIAYSGVIELLQLYVNRYGEWLDLAANAGGVILGLILAELLRYLLPDITGSTH